MTTSMLSRGRCRCHDHAVPPSVFVSVAAGLWFSPASNERETQCVNGNERPQHERGVKHSVKHDGMNRFLRQG
jgi:hypothetical protein